MPAVRKDQPDSGRRSRAPALRKLPPGPALDRGRRRRGLRARRGAVRGPGADRLLGRLVRPVPAWSARSWTNSPRRRAGKVKLVKVDVDTSPGLSQRFDIQAIPTLMVIRDGRVVARQAGAAPAAALRSWLDDALAASAQ